MKAPVTKLKQWYTGFIDIKISPSDAEDFSISITPRPASKLKRVVDQLWKFWRRNWANIVLIVIALFTLIATWHPKN